MRIISGTLRSRRLNAPKGLSTRPTPTALRETIFNICQGRVEGARVLDLYSGSGALALEAISRGATSALCVDSNRHAQACIQGNANALGVASQVKILRKEVAAALEQLDSGKTPFDILFADPPYDETVTVGDQDISLAQHLVNTLDSSSFLSDGAWCFIEHGRNHEIDTSHLKNLERRSSRRVGSSVVDHFVFTTPITP